MKIIFDSINIEKPTLNYAKIKEWLENVAKDNNKKIKELAIVFCNDEYILEINKKYLNHDYYTDIITFNYSEKNYISGDLIISLDTVKDNSEKYKSNFYDEINRVMVHGVLHLLGFDDKTNEEQGNMNKKEDYYLNQLYNHLYD